MPHFNREGWYVNEVIEGRYTSVSIPDEVLPEGSGWNFTGYKWVMLGLNPTPAIVERPVPPVVSRRQARQALLLAGKLEEVSIAIDSIKDPITKGMTQIAWEDSTEFERQSKTLIELAKALGLDDKQLDDLFIKAASL